MDIKYSKELQHSWLRTVKKEGKSLNHALIQTLPDLVRMFTVVRSAYADPESVTLVFEGPREFLSMPYELLYHNDDILAMQHPLCRKIIDSTNTYKDIHFDDAIQTLRNKNQALRVLLIASDNEGNAADAHVIALRQLLLEQTKHIKLPAIIDILDTDQSSINKVQQYLKHCTYHLVHYAGQGSFNEEIGEKSGMCFWERESRQGKRVTLTASKLADILDTNEIRLFYLNACIGITAVAGDDQQYQGMIDALAHCDIPYVLGFRWYMPENNSLDFATNFYQHLFSQRPYTPEKALLRARQHAYTSFDSNINEAWTAPILLAQTPYHSLTRA